MKDIYELLNDSTIDINEFEEMEVTNLEKAKMKKVLKTKVNKKKKRSNWKRNALAVALILSISTATIGISYPAYAGNIPVIGDIFRFLDSGKTGLYEDYKEYSSEVLITEESNDIKITVNDAIFDGKTVTLTYDIESKHDLGESPHIFGSPVIKGSEGGSATSSVSRIDARNYVGIISSTDLGNKLRDEASVKWLIEKITFSTEEGDKEINGDWHFGLNVKATESSNQILGSTIEQNGVKVNIEKMTITPMSYVVYYNQVVSQKVKDKWDDVYVELAIKDDLGNVYSGQGNGGSGKDPYNIGWSKTFKKLNPNASNLIVTPTVSFTKYGSNNHGGVEMTETGEKKIIAPTALPGYSKDVTFDEIIIEIEK